MAHRKYQNRILTLIDRSALKFGFEKHQKTSEKIIKGKLISKTETTIGLYRDQNAYSAFIHVDTSRDLLGKVQYQLESLREATAFFEGENYVFLSLGNKSFAFNSKFFRNIKDMISEINIKMKYKVVEYMVSPNGELAALKMDDKSLFLVAGLLGYSEYAQEERISLVKKIDAARPFFNFEPYKKVDWSILKKPVGQNFESLAEKILTNQRNIIDVQPIGKTNASDRGRDFLVREKSLSIGGQTTEIKWLVQCKFSEKSISPKTLPDWTNRVMEHNVDGFWLITNNDVTPDLFDQLKDAGENHKLKIQTRLWQRTKFDTIFNTHPELFTKDNFS